MPIPSLPAYSLPKADDLPQSKVDWQLDLSRCTLLIHDMQQYFINFYGENNPLVAELQKNICSLRDWAKRNQVPVIYTAQPTEQSSGDRALLNDMWGPGLTAAEPELQQIVAPLTPDNTDTILEKWRYSAFFRSELIDILRENDKDQLLICGVYAHIGCLATALDAFMHDIKPFLVADALGDFCEEDHHMALRYTAGRCGRVISTKYVTATGSMTELSLSREWLKGQILELIDEDAEFFEENENLIDYGLDSVQVMTLISRWQSYGIHLRFEELAAAPSFNNWWKLIENKIPNLRK